MDKGYGCKIIFHSFGIGVIVLSCTQYYTSLASLWLWLEPSNCLLYNGSMGCHILSPGPMTQALSKQFWSKISNILLSCANARLNREWSQCASYFKTYSDSWGSLPPHYLKQCVRFCGMNQAVCLKAEFLLYIVSNYKCEVADVIKRIYIDFIGAIYALAAYDQPYPRKHSVTCWVRLICTLWSSCMSFTTPFWLLSQCVNQLRARGIKISRD